MSRDIQPSRAMVVREAASLAGPPRRGRRERAAVLAPSTGAPVKALMGRDGQPSFGGTSPLTGHAPPAVEPPSITIAIPPIALPTAVHVHAPAPALVTKRNASHLGMTPAELLRTLRAMRADPRFRDAVICHGKSYRGAAPDAIVAYLRAAPGAVAAASEDDGIDHALLTKAGLEMRSPVERRARR